MVEKNGTGKKQNPASQCQAERTTRATTTIKQEIPAANMTEEMARDLLERQQLLCPAGAEVSIHSISTCLHQIADSKMQQTAMWNLI
jgi:hypothetical protein